jgi:hypothetical protein
MPVSYTRAHSPRAGCTCMSSITGLRPLPRALAIHVNKSRDYRTVFLAQGRPAPSCPFMWFLFFSVPCVESPIPKKNTSPRTPFGHPFFFLPTFAHLPKPLDRVRIFFPYCVFYNGGRYFAQFYYYPKCC